MRHRILQFALLAIALAVILPATLAHSAGTVSTLASGLTNISHLRFDSHGNLFYTSRSGYLAKIPAGGGAPVAVATGFSDPIGLAIDSHDNMYVAEYQGGSVDKVTPSYVHTTFHTGLSSPDVVAVDAQDNVYVGEIFTRNVYKITPAGVMSLYGNANVPNQPGAGTSRLAGLGFDGNGNLFCGTYGDGSGYPGPFGISYIPPGGGTGIAFGSFALPAVDFAQTPCNTMLVAGYHLDRIGLLDPSAAMMTFAGTGVAGFLDGSTSTARFNMPSGVTVGPDGLVYVADNTNARIRVINYVDGYCFPTPTRRSTWGGIKAHYR
jgi:hypothetical protein